MPFSELIRQVSILLGLPAVLLAAAVAVVIVVVRDWRLAVFAYAVLAAVLALLLSQVIPSEWALLQAIVGGLISVMLFLSARQLRWRQGSDPGLEMRWPQMSSLTSFRALAVALAVVAFFAVRELTQLPKITPLFRDALLWLGLMGLLGLALHEEPLHAGLALLTILGGFQLLLFSLVQQRMLVGLIQGEQLLLGLAISYLVLSRGLVRAEPELESQVLRRQA